MKPELRHLLEEVASGDLTARSPLVDLLMEDYRNILWALRSMLEDHYDNGRSAIRSVVFEAQYRLGTLKCHRCDRKASNGCWDTFRIPLCDSCLRQEIEVQNYLDEMWREVIAPPPQVDGYEYDGHWAHSDQGELTPVPEDHTEDDIPF